MAKPLTDLKILDELKKCVITHIIWLPDSEARFMYDAMKDVPSITLVPVCHEAEAPAIAAGLTVAGKKPIVLIQNTGFFECGDSLRGTILDIKLPLLLMLGYRGYRSGKLSGTAAIYLEPILDAWGIKHYLLESDDDINKISAAYKQTNETSHPVAVLIGKEYEQA